MHKHSNKKHSGNNSEEGGIGKEHNKQKTKMIFKQLIFQFIFYCMNEK